MYNVSKDKTGSGNTAIHKTGSGNTAIHKTGSGNTAIHKGAHKELNRPSDNSEKNRSPQK